MDQLDGNEKLSPKFWSKQNEQSAEDDSKHKGYVVQAGTISMDNNAFDHPIVSKSNTYLDNKTPENPQAPEIDLLQEWAVSQSVNQTQVQGLINILRPRLLPELPKCPKTFLKTTLVKYRIIPMDDAKEGEVGEYVYFGIAEGLQQCIDPKVFGNGVIPIQVNIDGVPIYVSSTIGFWPILGKVFFNPDVYKPFVISIYCGKSKPKSADDYLKQFIFELNGLLRQGLWIEGVHYQVEVHSFILDKPARSFVKGVKGHTGYWSCERCTVEGYNFNGKIIFPHNDCELRTDETFRTMKNEEHHKYISPLLRIDPPVDMIAQFSLDYMHNFCLGIVKSFFSFLVLKQTRAKLRSRDISKIDARIRLIKNQIPKEFQRKPRSITEFGRYKAIEFHLQAAYLGIILFKNILPQDNYKHFLLLHCSFRILSSEDLCLEYANTAAEYLNRYFLGSQVLYGLGSCTFNLHSAIHMADDVKNLKCNLPKISAFSFENFLGKLKKKVRTPYKPLSQVCRRLEEEKFQSKSKPQLPEKFETYYDRSGKIRSFKFENKFYISCSRPDNCVMLLDGKIVYISEILNVSETLYIKGYILKSLKPIYTYPFSSSNLGINEVSEDLNLPISFDAEEISKKVMLLNLKMAETEKMNYFTIPLMH